MQEWWMSLDLFSQTLWGIAIFTSLIFLGQTIMTFAGMHSDISDINIDINGDSADVSGPFQLFTFRNFVNFFLGFSWAALAFQNTIENTFLLLGIAAIIGALLVIAVMFIFKWMSNMEESGNIDIHQAVGCQGNVYLTIPAQKSKEGKVQIAVQKAIREYDAITEGDTLPTGTPIRVVEVLNDNLLLVEKL